MHTRTCVYHDMSVRHRNYYVFDLNSTCERCSWINNIMKFIVYAECRFKSRKEQQTLHVQHMYGCVIKKQMGMLSLTQIGRWQESDERREINIKMIYTIKSHRVMPIHKYISYAALKETHREKIVGGDRLCILCKLQVGRSK